MYRYTVLPIVLRARPKERNCAMGVLRGLLPRAHPSRSVEARAEEVGGETIGPSPTTSVAVKME